MAKTSGWTLGNRKARFPRGTNLHPRKHGKYLHKPACRCSSHTSPLRARTPACQFIPPTSEYLLSSGSVVFKAFSRAEPLISTKAFHNPPTYKTGKQWVPGAFESPLFDGKRAAMVLFAAVASRTHAAALRSLVWNAGAQAPRGDGQCRSPCVLKPEPGDVWAAPPPPPRGPAALQGHYSRNVCFLLLSSLGNYPASWCLFPTPDTRGSGWTPSPTCFRLCVSRDGNSYSS